MRRSSDQRYKQPTFIRLGQLVARFGKETIPGGSSSARSVRCRRPKGQSGRGRLNAVRRRHQPMKGTELHGQLC
jgi:hypothetical protein